MGRSARTFLTPGVPPRREGRAAPRTRPGQRNPAAAGSGRRRAQGGFQGAAPGGKGPLRLNRRWAASRWGQGSAAAAARPGPAAPPPGPAATGERPEMWAPGGRPDHHHGLAAPGTPAQPPTHPVVTAVCEPAPRPAGLVRRARITGRPNRSRRPPRAGPGGARAVARTGARRGRALPLTIRPHGIHGSGVQGRAGRGLPRITPGAPARRAPNRSKRSFLNDLGVAAGASRRP